MFADVVGGAVVFSKAGDPDENQWDDAIILDYCGDVPDAIKGAGLIEPGRPMLTWPVRRRSPPSIAGSPVQEKL